MGVRQLIVFSFVLACARLSEAQLHRVSVPTYWGIETQKPAVKEAVPGADPEREHSSQSAQQAGRLQAKQLQPAVELLSWKFPEDPVPPTKKPPVKFELQQPVATNSYAVRCGENKIQVEVSQDLLGLGKLVKPEEITLGGCSAADIDALSHVLIFESELHGCGSTLVITETAFIYAFTLVYNPQVFGRSQIMRSQSAVIGVECHYVRKHGVSSNAVQAASLSDKEQPYFSLQLMTDDWKSERTSNKYSLGDFMNLQASVSQHTGTPLRVLVDSCVATVRPDSTSEPQRALVKNSGCLGGRRAGFRSRFMPQSQPDKLQFQIEALGFHPHKAMYISCKLKALPASSPVTIERKACFFEGRWRAVRGKDLFCTCCEATCGMRKIRDLDADTSEEQWKAELTLGPIVVE